MTEHSRRPHRALNIALYAGVTLVALAGCRVSKEPPKVPLGAETTAAASDTSNPHADRLPPAARTAIDLANAQFRAKKYPDALKSYREAAKAAPTSAAAYFGIYMVAQKLNDKALADSALKVIQASSGKDLTDSTLREVHVNPKEPVAKKS